MNLAASAPAWLFVLLLAALAAAAIEDAYRLRISNITCVAVLAGAVVAAALAGPTWALWENIGVFAALLALGTIAFGARIFGGGDVKLIAALGLWVDAWSAVQLITAIFIAGGALAIVVMLPRLVGKKRAKRTVDRRLPYGVAIALGAAAIFQLDRTERASRAAPLPSLPAQLALPSDAPVKNA